MSSASNSSTCCSATGPPSRRPKTSTSACSRAIRTRRSESAEVLLKERSLTSYYDEVALRGLQLAANDADRGVLTQRQLEQVKDVIRALVQDLGGHDDVEPHAGGDRRRSGRASRQRETRRSSSPGRAGAAAAGARIPEDWKAEGADPVRRRPRSPRRGRGRDAGAASRASTGSAPASSLMRPSRAGRSSVST